MSEYTPTTDEVCAGWMSSGPPASTVVRAIGFARWLDQVTAEARREGQAEAWAEGAQAYGQFTYSRGEMCPINPYRNGAGQ